MCAEEQARQPCANRTLLADMIIKLSAEVRARSATNLSCPDL
jgi:hypothetical protein